MLNSSMSFGSTLLIFHLSCFGSDMSPHVPVSLMAPLTANRCCRLLILNCLLPHVLCGFGIELTVDPSSLPAIYPSIPSFHFKLRVQVRVMGETKQQSSRLGMGFDSILLNLNPVPNPFKPLMTSIPKKVAE